MAVVFFVLAVLFAIVRALSSVFVIRGKTVDNVKTAAGTTESVHTEVNSIAVQHSPAPAKLTLSNVDERIAAMIMAIVSHDSQIPLSELRFISIRARN